MRYEIRYQPAFALAILSLDPGEEVLTEGGAMVSMSGNISLQTEVRGGVFGALKRAVLGGESFFTSRYRAEGGPGELTVAPTLPGDITALELSGQTMMLRSGSWLAGGPGLTVDSQWGGARGFFGTGGLFLLKVSGHGTVLFSTYGALHAKELAPGERYVVDTEHVVAFSQEMGFQVRKAASGWMSTITSGEGLVCEFTGPGLVYLQTRSEHAFLHWLIPRLPNRSNQD